MSADLKTCPFCRAPDEELALCYDAGTHPLVGTDWFVRCYVCHVETARFVTQAEAVTAWNTRAEGPAPVSAPLDREGVEIDPEKHWLWLLNERLGGYQTVFDAIGHAVDASHPGRKGISVISFMEGIWPQVTKAYSALTGQQDQVGLTTPAVLGEPDIDGLPSQSCADGSPPVLTDGEEFLEFKEALSDLRSLRHEHDCLNGGGPGWAERNAAAWAKVDELFANEDEAAYDRQQEDAHG